MSKCNNPIGRSMTRIRSVAIGHGYRTSLMAGGAAFLALSASATVARAAPVTFGYNGTNSTTGSIVDYTVPQTGAYALSAIGGQGGSGGAYSGAGGLGAEAQGDFLLTQGEVLQIAVGQAGFTGFFNNTSQPFPAGAAGGGGGSFIVGPGNAPLVIAGGGGGAANNLNGGNALTGTQGGAGSGAMGGAGGSGGQGGTGASGGGGGGFLSAGMQPAGGYFSVSGSGGTFPGLAGGAGVLGETSGGYGGFGGGGGGGDGGSPLDGGGGGGGGFSGGGGGGFNASFFTGEPGGGGGSFDAGLDPVLLAGIGAGNGLVTITLLDALPTAVPAPASLALLLSGLVGLLAVRHPARWDQSRRF